MKSKKLDDDETSVECSISEEGPEPSQNALNKKVLDSNEQKASFSEYSESSKTSNVTRKISANSIDEEIVTQNKQKVFSASSISSKSGSNENKPTRSI